MKRLAIVFGVLALLTAGAVYACNPAVSYSRTAVAYTPSYSVSVVQPYTPTVSLPAAYAPVAAPACVCEQPQVGAPAAYEPPQVAAPVVRSYVASVAAPVAYAPVGYAGVRVGVAHVGYGHVGHHVGAVRVGVANVGRRAATVTVAKAGGRRLGIIGRIQVKRAAVRAARAAR